ncbi:MAG: nitroreductase family protein [Oscillospiraceae bacterium]|nr:nitroreductase family protein [Oscillospiraceae bacterium]
MNETLKVLESRRSCRSFNPDKMVPEEELQAVIKAGTYTALSNHIVLTVIKTPQAAYFTAQPVVFVYSIAFIEPAMSIFLSLK